MSGLKGIRLFAFAASAVASFGTAHATATCPVTDHGAFVNALKAAEAADTGGAQNHFWAVVVDREGIVCEVAFSGGSQGDQWLLSRQIAAAKAFTANGLSLNSKPTSTGMLYGWVQPSPNQTGVPLYGVAGGNVLSDVAYGGLYGTYGTLLDPMKGKRVGGTITFGGGLGLYSGTTVKGGLGLSGDTACRDHSVAWRLRAALNMAPSAGDDSIIISDNRSYHPHCAGDSDTQGATFQGPTH